MERVPEEEEAQGCRLPDTSIASEYDLDDLDDEWMRLLQSIDDLYGPYPSPAFTLMVSIDKGQRRNFL